MNVLVIDARAGGIEKQAVSAIKANFPDAKAVAIGQIRKITG